MRRSCSRGASTRTRPLGEALTGGCRARAESWMATDSLCLSTLSLSISLSPSALSLSLLLRSCGRRMHACMRTLDLHRAHYTCCTLYTWCHRHSESLATIFCHSDACVGILEQLTALGELHPIQTETVLGVKSPPLITKRRLVCIYIYICMYVCMCVYSYIYIYIHMYIHTHTYRPALAKPCCCSRLRERCKPRRAPSIHLQHDSMRLLVVDDTHPGRAPAHL